MLLKLTFFVEQNLNDIKLLNSYKPKSRNLPCSARSKLVLKNCEHRVNVIILSDNENLGSFFRRFKFYCNNWYILLTSFTFGAQLYE